MTIDIKNIDGNGKAIRSQMVNGNTQRVSLEH